MRRGLFFLAYSFIPYESFAFTSGWSKPKHLQRTPWRARQYEIEAASAFDRSQRSGQRITGGLATMQIQAGETKIIDEGSLAKGGRKKVVVIGAGWAGLAAAYELSKQVISIMCR